MKSLYSFFSNLPEINKPGNVAFFLFIIVYVIFIVYLGNTVVLWQDEACSLHTATNPFFKVINLSYYFEGQPPVYFLLLSIWLKFLNGIWFARLLSLIFVLLSAILIHKIGRLILTNIYSKWVIVLFLLNPYTIELGMEARLYSFLMFLGLTTIYLFYQIYYFNNTKLKPIYLIIGIIGVYTQYYFAFVLVSLAVLLLITRGWRPFVNFFTWSLIIVIAISPTYPFIKDQFLMHKPVLFTRSWVEWCAYIMYSPAHLIMDVNTFDSGMKGRIIGQLIFTLLVVVIGYKLYNVYKLTKSEEIKKIFELCTLVVILLSVFLLLFIITNLTYSLRYLATTFPIFFLILIGLSVFKKNIKILLFASFASYYILLLVINYQHPLVKAANGKSTALYISNMEYKDEPILFRDKILNLLVKPYYKGTNELFSIRGLQDIANFNDIQIKDTSDLKTIINNLVPTSKTFIYINGNDFGYVSNNELSNSEADIYFGKHYKVSSDTIINGKLERHFLRIRRFVKK